MRRSLIALAVVSVLVLAASVPASAQTWIQLRYRATDNTWNWTGSSVLSQSTWGGVSLSRSVMGGAWALSFNYDAGSDNYPGGGTGQRNMIWNANVHRNFPMPTGALSFYVGWGGASYEAPNSAGNWSWRQSGPRLGADAKINLRSDWYVVGDAGYNLAGNVTLNNIFVPGTRTETASIVDWKLGLGRTFGAWGLEGGYRSFAWRVQPAATTCTGTPCGPVWAGWYFGLNFTTP